MAVAQEFIDVFIRIADVDRVYPGGWARYLTDFANQIGHTTWYDDHLLREGAMSATDADAIVSEWMRLGLSGFRAYEGKPEEWLDICVSESMGGASLTCSWIAYDVHSGGAYLKGTQPGVLAWPHKRGDAEGWEDEQWVSDPTFRHE